MIDESERVRIKAEVIDWIAEGKTLREFCRIDGNPNYSTLYLWMDKDQEFLQRFAHARKIGEKAIAEDCLQIADTAEDANLAKVRIWTRLELLKRWNPKDWGDRTTLAGDAENPIAIKRVIADV